MSGRRVLALYAALLFGFAGVLCRLFYLASRTDYAARAAAQSTVTLELPARRGGFYDCMGLPFTGLEKRWLALCFPGQDRCARSCWGIWTVMATVLPGWKKHWTRCSPAAGHGTPCCAR